MPPCAAESTQNPAAALEWSQEGILRLSGPLTFRTAGRLFEQREQHSDHGMNRIDLSGVTKVDSTGLALLLEWQAQSNASNETLTMTGAPASLLRLATLCGAMKLINLSGNTE